MRTRLKKKSAFTLPEALITIALLASVMLYFILAFTVGKYAAKVSRERAIVSNLLRSEIESVLNSNYPLQDASKGSSNLTVSDGSKDITVTKTLDFTTVDAGIYGYQKVYLKMEWAGGMSMEQTLKEEAVLYFTKE